ncbi:3'-5' exonuclease [Herpetosiphon llansteffanensis]
MNVIIADTFQQSLQQLTNNEQKAVKTTAFDLQINPAHPSFQMHRLERAKDAHFWSVRVNDDIRIILHKTDLSILLCYVDHHDAAYQWAMRRKIEQHPRTGAAQLVEIRERVEEVVIYQPSVVAAPTPAKPAIFRQQTRDSLLNYAVPPEWLDDVLAATDDNFLDVLLHLPQEASEALMELAIGGNPSKPIVDFQGDPFAHPDAQRRFRVLNNVEELERALEYPWEQWTVFLHPVQRQFVERGYNGPVRVAGSAGTGKTVVALHRAVHLAKLHPHSQILLATFSPTLANALHHKLNRLIGNEPAIRERITIADMHELALDLAAEHGLAPQIIEPAALEQLLNELRQLHQLSYNLSFLVSEWASIVDAWNVHTWEAYRDVPRLGRKTRIGGKQREVLWAYFAEVRQALHARGLQTWSMLWYELAGLYATIEQRPYAFAIIDEAQDLDVAELHFLAALGNQHPDSLFFAGDQGQRIFQQPFSWKQVGVDIRGRSHTLTINYRTSHQIRSQADQLLPKSMADVDGNREARNHTISVFNGAPPQIVISKTIVAEQQAIVEWLQERQREGIQAHEIGVFVRSTAELGRAEATLQASGLPWRVLDQQLTAPSNATALATMHLAKGLEFRAVVVMACDDQVIPSQARLNSAADESDIGEIYTTERHLLYVACTRARDQLLVTGVAPASEFLDDLGL